LRGVPMSRRDFRRCGVPISEKSRCRKPAGASGYCAEHALAERELAAWMAADEPPKVPWWRRWLSQIPVISRLMVREGGV